MTAGDLICPEKQRKVFKLRNGCLFGHSGNAEEGVLLKHALSRNLPIPKVKDSDAICIMPNGDVLYFEGKVWTRIDVPYVAIGSGKQFAYGAMAAGASAREAVKAACTLEKHSGLPIHIVKLRKHED